MARPIIALLTDFGTRDHYAGAIKGVILGLCPDVTLVDIGHDLPPHDVMTAALELAACYRYFPAGTIFLVVVDPGVGSARRAIAVEAGDYKFVAPDNGVLTMVLTETPAKRMVELTERKYARATVSRTFEGRDRFAPAAAWLAKGITLTALGRPMAEAKHLDVPVPRVTSDGIEGEVVRVDRFGNLITNIDRKTFEHFAAHGSVAIVAGAIAIARLVATYDEAEAGEPCALFGSTDHLELAVKGSSAAEALVLGRGALVGLRRA